MEITALTPIKDYFAGYAAEDESGDKMVPVICLAACREDEGPDEVIGQVWNGDCITEAPGAFDPEDDSQPDLTFIGYFQRKQEDAFKTACEAWRDEEDEEDDEGEDED